MSGPESLLPSSRARRAAEMEELLAAVAALGRDLLAREEELPGGAARDPGQLAAALDLALPDAGRPLAEVMARLRAVLLATPSSSSWRFVNQLFAGREPAATAAAMLTPLVNISMYTFKAGGAQILVERELLHRMCAAAGFTAGEGAFTPGGSFANFLALVLARNEALPGARETGVAGARLVAYTSAEGHYSVPKNAGLAGIGRANVRAIAVDGRGRMLPEALAAAIAADRAAGLRPFFVNATAGTTVRGAFDPLGELGDVARAAGLWFHVDAAFGGSLLLSPEHRRLLAGSERADSLAWDPHKMMGVPLQSSVLLLARRGLLARNLDESADYLFQADPDELNPGRRSLQCGRPNDALKLWAAWQRLGSQGWAARLGRQMALARRAAELIRSDPELRLAEEPPSLNVCFEVRGRASDAVCDRLDRDGLLKIGHGIVAGRRTIRLVCSNADLGDADLAEILAEIKAAARSLPPGDNAVAG